MTWSLVPLATGIVEQATLIDADTATALRTPPPGAARAPYLAAMTYFRAFGVALLTLDAKTVGADLGNGKPTPAQIQAIAERATAKLAA
jgi:hypothetical protein